MSDIVIANNDLVPLEDGELPAYAAERTGVSDDGSSERGGMFQRLQVVQSNSDILDERDDVKAGDLFDEHMLVKLDQPVTVLPVFTGNVWTEFADGKPKHQTSSKAEAISIWGEDEWRHNQRWIFLIPYVEGAGLLLLQMGGGAAKERRNFMGLYKSMGGDLFARAWAIQTEKRTSDKGSYFVPVLSLVEAAPSEEAYNMAKAAAVEVGKQWLTGSTNVGYDG